MVYPAECKKEALVFGVQHLYTMQNISYS